MPRFEHHPYPRFTYIIYILSNDAMLLPRMRLSPVLLTYTELSAVVRRTEHTRFCAPESGLPDHLIRPEEEGWRDGETEGLRGLEVDHELEFT
jgi:hypothetical protein